MLFAPLPSPSFHLPTPRHVASLFRILLCTPRPSRARGPIIALYIYSCSHSTRGLQDVPPNEYDPLPDPCFDYAEVCEITHSLRRRHAVAAWWLDGVWREAARSNISIP